MSETEKSRKVLWHYYWLTTLPCTTSDTHTAAKNCLKRNSKSSRSFHVLMPRVVKRRHLHNQIIKICIIWIFYYYNFLRKFRVCLCQLLCFCTIFSSSEWIHQYQFIHMYVVCLINLYKKSVGIHLQISDFDSVFKSAFSRNCLLLVIVVFIECCIASHIISIAKIFLLDVHYTRTIK